MQRFETKYDLLNAAYKDRQLKKGTILLLQYLVHKSNKEQCFPAVETIAKALNVCRRIVQYNMRKLEKAGYIIRKDRWYNHQQLTNQYVFNLGVTEDALGQMMYTDQEYDFFNDFTFNIPDKQIHKVSEIQKIYSMELTAGEKLLLIYLCHRANKKGMVYDTPQAFMDAIGVRKNTFKRLLNMLRSKGLLKVKHTILRNQDYLVMQLTGNMYQLSEKEEETAENEHKEVPERNPESGNNIQNLQNHIIKNSRTRKWQTVVNSQIRIFISKLKQSFQSKWRKIREILRL